MGYEKVYAMSFAKVYPLLAAKAEKKGRTLDELNTVDGIPYGGNRGCPKEADCLWGIFPKCPNAKPKPEVDNRDGMRRACGGGQRASDAGNPVFG